MNTLIIMITAAIASLVTLIILFFRKKRIERKQNKPNILEEDSAVKDRGRVVPMPEVNWNKTGKESTVPIRDMSMSEIMQEIRKTLPTEYTKELPNIQIPGIHTYNPLTFQPNFWLPPAIEPVYSTGMTTNWGGVPSVRGVSGKSGMDGRYIPIQGKSGMDGRPIKVKTVVNPQLDRMKALMGRMNDLENLEKLYE
jgi:hypothetical protein